MALKRTGFDLQEKQTAIYSFSLIDENGAAVSPASLPGATLTLYSLDSSTKPIINNRNAQNCLNQNDVTISAAGVVTWTIQVADVSILDNSLQKETHRALFLFTWNAGSPATPRSKPHEVDLVIRNLHRLT